MAKISVYLDANASHGVALEIPPPVEPVPWERVAMEPLRRCPRTPQLDPGGFHSGAHSVGARYLMGGGRNWTGKLFA